MKIRIRDTYDDRDIMILNGILAFTAAGAGIIILIGMALHVC